MRISWPSSKLESIRRAGRPTARSAWREPEASRPPRIAGPQRSGGAELACGPERRCSPLFRRLGQAVFLAFFGFVSIWCGAETPGSSAAPKKGRGYLYSNDRVPEVPWSIHIVKIDRPRDDFELVTTLGQDQVLGLATLTSQIKTLPPDLGRPIAAINGDFYRTENEPYSGDPRGLAVVRGELVSAPAGTVCFWVDTGREPRMAEVASGFKVTWPNGETSAFGLNEELRGKPAALYTPRLGASTLTSGVREFILEREGTNSWLPLAVGETYRARVREIREAGNSPLASNIMVLAVSRQLASRLSGVAAGAVLKISTATTPDLRGIKTAIGGGPLLVENGKVQKPVTNKAMDRHPRSALGWNQKHLFLVEVDGRQNGLSVGMNLRELAEYMAKLGCEFAMNLDGGGSSELWVDGQVMNSPCYHRERPTATGLVLIQKRK